MSAEKLKIIFTSKSHKCSENLFFDEGQSFEIHAGGIKDWDKYREDRLVIFGKHSHCDIRFPTNEKNISLVSLLVYNSKNNWHAVDCSLRGYSAVKLKNNVKFDIFEGLMINIARKSLININKISYEPTSELVHSTVSLSFVEGPYDSKNEYFITTKTEKRGEFKNLQMIGRGGRGRSPDIFIPEEFSASRKHLYFKYKDS